MRANEEDRVSYQESSVPRRKSSSAPFLITCAVLGLLLAAAAGIYHFFIKSEPVRWAPEREIDERLLSGLGPELLEPAEVSADARASYDLPTQVPELDASDASLLVQLTKLGPLENIVAWSAASDLARKFVGFIYNLAAGEINYRMLPLNSPEGPFMVQAAPGGGLRIDPASYERYNVYAKAISEIDARRATEVYRFFWPVFKTAFAELGEPRKSFHNEVLQSIDHLLATPEPEGYIGVFRPAIQYKFSDPALEALSRAQKQMLRLGPQNRAMIKSKLFEVRQLLNAPQ